MDGYKIIDFKGENLSEGHVDGIWDAITTSNKPLVFCNFTIGESTEIQKPFFAGFGRFRTVEADTNGYDYIISEDSGNIIKFTITSKDNVVIGA